jgi:hypothetical protein
MPRNAEYEVGDFSGRGVHGTGGDVRYEDGSGTTVHVHREPEKASWSVSVDEGQTGRPGTVMDRLGRQEALHVAYGYMLAESRGGSGGWLGGDML